MLVLAARSARAEDSAAREQERRTFLARVGMSASLIGGSRIVGMGSRERYVQPGLSVIDFKLARMFAKSSWGFELAMQAMIPTERGLGYAQIEVAADILLADGPWGSLIVGLGGGADYGRYWWDGRAYPLVVLRERTWLSRKVRLEFETRTIPIAATGKLPLFEQRFELALGVGLFCAGLRFGWAAAWGGLPNRTYEQHELGAFMGVGF
jgi:hypothetical protein